MMKVAFNGGKGIERERGGEKKRNMLERLHALFDLEFFKNKPEKTTLSS